MLNFANRNTLTGFLLAVSAAIGFSAKAILVKLAYYDPVDAVTLLALRMLFSVPVFLCVALFGVSSSRTQAMSRRDLFSVLVLGLLGFYLSSLFDFIGLQYITASLERLILFLYPTLVVILSVLVLGKAFGRRETVALLLSYIGIGLVCLEQFKVDSEHLLLGAGCVFASTLSYSLYLVGAGQTIARIGATRFTAYAMLVACMATLLQFFCTHSPVDLIVPPRVYRLSLFMAIFSTVLPVFMLSWAIHRIGSAHTSMIGAIGPVATLCMASVVLDEEMTLLQIGGGALVVGGVLVLVVKRAARHNA